MFMSVKEETVLSPEASECRKQYMREYLRNWRKQNPDKMKTYKARFWEKKAMEMEQKK